jgi:hypothetical protein
LRIATISFATYVRPTSWNNSVPNRRIFMKFDTRFFSVLSSLNMEGIRSFLSGILPVPSARIITWYKHLTAKYPDRPLCINMKYIAKLRKSVIQTFHYLRKVDDGWHNNLEHSYWKTAGDASSRVVLSFRWKLVLKRTIWRHAKIISKIRYLLKLVSACKVAQLVCCRERPADECGTNKVPDGQEHSCCRLAHRQPSTADAARQMQSAHSSWYCGSCVAAQCKSFATLCFITPASVHLVRGSNFVSETVYPGRFSGITQVI